MVDVDPTRQAAGPSPATAKRLVACRYLLQLARLQVASDREPSDFAALLLLQDCLELFLVTSAEHVDAKINRQTEIAQIFDKVDEQISPKRLPFRAKLLKLNKTRLSSKHDGLIPNHTDVEEYALVCEEFLRESFDIVYGISPESFTLIDLLADGEAKQFLKQALLAIESENFYQALIEVRKAFYITFEQKFDISKYDTDEETTSWFFGFGCHAPAYAKSKNYIDRNVREPFDYIVFDNGRIESELMKESVKPNTFWNVWRLTPAVFRKSDGSWLVSYEFDKATGENLRNAHYALDATVEMLISKQENFKSTKWITDRTDWIVNLRGPGVRIYEKADINSKVVGLSVDGATQVRCSHCTPGLRDDNTYWKVANFQQDGPSYFGYVLETDVVFPEG